MAVPGSCGNAPRLGVFSDMSEAADRLAALERLASGPITGPQEEARWIQKAFPAVDADGFRERWYIDWDIRTADLDGRPPSDVILFLRHSASLGPYEKQVAVRSGNRVVYQRFVGFYRGLYNALRRVGSRLRRAQGKPPLDDVGHGGEKSSKRFLTSLGLSEMAPDLDGDGRQDLIMVGLLSNPCFFDGDMEQSPDVEEDPLCGNNAMLSFFSDPAFLER